jgi:YD repeat-containing protein
LAGYGRATTAGAGKCTRLTGSSRLSLVKEADGNTTQYSYDARGNLKTVNMAGQYRAG